MDNINDFGAALVSIAQEQENIYNAGYAAGKADLSNFWDVFQNNGTRTVYAYAFYNWPDSAFYPKWDMIPETGDGPANMFYMSNIEDLASRLLKCGVSLDLSKCPKLGNTFYRCASKSLPVIDMASCDNAITTFQQMRNLTDLTIINLKETCVLDRTFQDCTKLTNLSIDGVIGSIPSSGGGSSAGVDLTKSTSLSSGSVLNVINALRAEGPLAGPQDPQDGDKIKAPVKFNATVLSNAITAYSTLSARIDELKTKGWDIMGT